MFLKCCRALAPKNSLHEKETTALCLGKNKLEFGFYSPTSHWDGYSNFQRTGEPGLKASTLKREIPSQGPHCLIPPSYARKWSGTFWWWSLSAQQPRYYCLLLSRNANCFTAAVLAGRSWGVRSAEPSREVKYSKGENPMPSEGTWLWFPPGTSNYVPCLPLPALPKVITSGFNNCYCSFLFGFPCTFPSNLGFSK